MQDPRWTAPFRPPISGLHVPLAPASPASAPSLGLTADAFVSLGAPDIGRPSLIGEAGSRPALAAGISGLSPLIPRTALSDLITLQLVCLLPRLQSSLDRLEAQLARLATQSAADATPLSTWPRCRDQAALCTQGPPFFGDTVDLWSHDRVAQVFQVGLCHPAGEIRRHLTTGGGTCLPFWTWWEIFSRCLPPAHWILCFRCFGCPEPISPDADYPLLGSLLYRYFCLAGSMHTPLQDLPGL